MPIFMEVWEENKKYAIKRHEDDVERRQRNRFFTPSADYPQTPQTPLADAVPVDYAEERVQRLQAGHLRIGDTPQTLQTQEHFIFSKIGQLRIELAQWELKLIAVRDRLKDIAT